MFWSRRTDHSSGLNILIEEDNVGGLVCFQGTCKDMSCISPVVSSDQVRSLAGLIVEAIDKELNQQPILLLHRRIGETQVNGWLSIG